MTELTNTQYRVGVFWVASRFFMYLMPTCGVCLYQTALEGLGDDLALLEKHAGVLDRNLFSDVQKAYHLMGGTEDIGGMEGVCLPSLRPEFIKFPHEDNHAPEF